MVENVHGLMTNVEGRSFYILVHFFPQSVVKQHKIHLIDILIACRFSTYLCIKTLIGFILPNMMLENGETKPELYIS